MVPGWLLAKAPTGNEVLAYCHLASFGTWNPGPGTYEECRPAIATLAERCGMSETNLRRALKGLSDKGALIASGARYDDRGGQLPTVYRVVFGTVSQGVPPVAPPPTAGGTPGVPPVAPNQEPSTKNPSTSSRGTRCPDDFMPSEKTKQWCQDNLPPRLMVAAGNELIKFRNYWTAKTGRDATKLDWDKTFVNWMLKAAERYTTAPLPSPKTFTEAADDYKAAKKAQRAVVLDLAQQLIDAGMDPMKAVKNAEAEVEARTTTPMSVESNAGVPYIDGDVVARSTTPEEVTGS